MPLYEYQCQSCHKRFEKIQKFSDPPVETCPDCGGKVDKLLSSPAIQFKGTGWYITDYAKKSSNEAGKSSSGSGAASTDTKSSESTSSSTTESKPAAASATKTD